MTNLCEENVLLLDDNVFEGDAPGVRATLAHVQLLPRYKYNVIVLDS